MPAAALPIARRDFLRVGAGAAAAGLWPSIHPQMARAANAKLRVGVVLTEFTYRSHAHVILENFLEPYLFNGLWQHADMNVPCFYVDQFPEGDMSRQVAESYGIKIYPTIRECLCQGGDTLAVDAVLSIGEHGNYPHNEKGQHEYPRKRFFDEIAAVCRTSGRGVPVFNDKHLSYRWDWAKEMYDTARELHMPLMAGSSVPLAERRPPLELPAGAKITEAVSIHAGGVESYDFHCLEVLQSMVEARAGGETGIREVQFLTGEPLWKAADEGRWSIELAELAMAAELGERKPLREIAAAGGDPNSAHGVLLTYTDGLRAIGLKLGSGSTRWNFACRLDGNATPQATSLYVGPWQNRNLFKALSHAIQDHFRRGQAPYPVERTLLVTGVLDAEMESRFQGGQPQATPHLEFSYAPRDFRAMREMGATWKIITEATPEPPGIDPGGRK
ncbi:MAG: hypothetical protein K1X74_11365 [Pirellulales bacterium]|nr:hypothetical protein [Pirellulales bacterium]